MKRKAKSLMQGLGYVTDHSKLKSWFVKSECKECALWKKRENVVFSRGRYKYPVLVLASSPVEREDAVGKSFVGKAGKKLGSMFKEEIGVDMNDLMLTNVVKCRPPNDRKPTIEEIELCYSVLERQVLLLEPSVILVLGNAVLRSILNETGKHLFPKIKMWVGREVSSLAKVDMIKFPFDKMRTFILFHPSYVVHDVSKEKEYRKSIRDFGMFCKEVGIIF